MKASRPHVRPRPRPLARRERTHSQRAGAPATSTSPSGSGFDRPRDIRKLIERNLPEIEAFGVAPRRGALQTRGNRGGTQEVEEYWLNEEKALLVAVLSKAPNAPAVRSISPFPASTFSPPRRLPQSPVKRSSTAPERARRMTVTRGGQIWRSKRIAGLSDSEKRGRASYPARPASTPRRWRAAAEFRSCLAAWR